MTRRDKIHDGVGRVSREIFGMLAGCQGKFLVCWQGVKGNFWDDGRVLIKVPECSDYLGCSTRFDFWPVFKGVVENMPSYF